jgi:2,4-dienoyl-CoA reductase-like NADH-dependent reductase (Old Yellow Enzyme family)/thioredoxin reductase
MSKLFEPIQIGNVQLKNRIVFPPMSTAYEERGMITDRSVNFYTTIAEGGTSLVIVGDLSIQPSFAPTPFVFDDMFIPGLKRLTDAVHEKDTKIAAQLFHQEYDTNEIGALMKTGGREAAMKKLHEEMRNYSNRISKDDIQAILEKFAAAAKRVQQAGFDIIQIHGDRLIGMFASPIINQRTDEYGGSLENRARFALEVVRRIKAAVPEMAIDYKMAVIRTDPPMGKGGPTIEESKTMAQWLVEAGVDSFHVALANHDNIGFTIPAMGTQPYGCFVDMAAAVKSAVNVPVAAVGRILFPEMAEKILADGQADIISLGRGLIADPEWPLKVKNGKTNEIRYCIMCNHCTDCLPKRMPVGCAVNATIGAETRISIEKAPASRKVLIIGGGPAGMEAARVAALKGHQVVLIEREKRLGGQVHIASVAPYKDEMRRIADYLAGRIEQLGVEVKTGTAFSAAMLDDIQPDNVIVATGARSKPMSGLPTEAKNVVDAWDVLDGKAEVGRHAVVFGGGAVGAEAAMFLAEKGHDVTVAFRSQVTLLDKIRQEKSMTLVPTLARYIEQKNIKTQSGVTPKAVSDKTLVLTDEAGNTTEIPCDTIVVAVGIQPNETFEAELKSRSIAYQIVGDCAEGATGFLSAAIKSGFDAANTL